MNELIEELRQIASELESLVKKSKQAKIEKPLQELEDVAERIGQSWSKSPLGSQANVYYNDFKPPPPGAHFSTRWGLRPVPISGGTRGDWVEYDPEEVRNLIHKVAEIPDLKIHHQLADEGHNLFDEKLSDVVSIFEIILTSRDDDVIIKLKEQTQKLRVLSASDIATFLSRGQFIVQGGQVPEIRIAAHISVLSEVKSIRAPFHACDRLLKITQRAASHLTRLKKNKGDSYMKGKKVFIGHGHSHLWREFKDFVQDSLGLPWDEFDRVPVAGRTIIDRLNEMLDDAGIAFLILTAEDEQKDGSMNARLNVVHEAGLFQGRLGFPKGIILLEAGCEEFSNIKGLNQIRFAKGNIKEIYEQIRGILKREGLL